MLQIDFFFCSENKRRKIQTVSCYSSKELFSLKRISFLVDGSMRLNYLSVF